MINFLKKENLTFLTKSSLMKLLLVDETAMLSYKNFKSIAIIPARGGSKSIPKKNIVPFCNKPLIYYTIVTAEKAGIFEKIIVSTDSDEIAEISRNFGAEVIKRPAEFAQDDSPTEDALIHVLDVLKERESYEPTVVMTLEPTAPLRSVETIQKMVDLYNSTEADSVMSFEAEHECHADLVDGKVEFYIKNPPRRRQDRKPVYKENGGTYLTEVSVLRRKRKVLGDNLYGYPIPPEEAIDINSPLSLEIARVMMERRRTNN